MAIPKMTPQQRAAAAAARSLAKSPREMLQDAKLGLSATREATILARLKEMPESCRRVYLRAVAGKSLRAAVKAQCLECVGWQRTEVEKCTAHACPLWAHRPYK